MIYCAAEEKGLGGTKKHSFTAMQGTPSARAIPFGGRGRERGLSRAGRDGGCHRERKISLFTGENEARQSAVHRKAHEPCRRRGALSGKASSTAGGEGEPAGSETLWRAICGEEEGREGFSADVWRQASGRKSFALVRGYCCGIVSSRVALLGIGILLREGHAWERFDDAVFRKVAAPKRERQRRKEHSA